ncbi:hypothetical protein KIKIMORA_01380 [Brevundimonas phage vB_BpoS-Kikimora]|uniref:Uncharacterized protein n=1 Tax=Brevundimonas phage vB_BpoS-Kikimora TaxID=2948601 RepID=A0A9E7MRU8_9CAUD|nr:hypothetical protein KIKIMORA_01380 [Brevundimonas phage vB_BpoS-Kikimora]
MLAPVIAYHRAEIESAAQVIKADGNLYSAEQRDQARKQLALHQELLDRLLAIFRQGTADDVVVLRYLIGNAQDDAEQYAQDKIVAGDAYTGWIDDDIAITAQTLSTLQACLGMMLESHARPRRTHIKRGGAYTLYGAGIIQTETPLKDGDNVVIYRDEDGRWWARPPIEMYDGRFGHNPRTTEDVDPQPVTVYFEDREVAMTLNKHQRDLLWWFGQLDMSTAPELPELEGWWTVTSSFSTQGRLTHVAVERD